MDELALTENDLAAAERHVADSARDVALQREIIGDPQSGGSRRKDGL